MTNLVKSKKVDTKDISSKPPLVSEVVNKAGTLLSIGVVHKTQNDSSTSERAGKPAASGLTLLASYSGSDSDSQ